MKLAKSLCFCDRKTNKHLLAGLLALALSLSALSFVKTEAAVASPDEAPASSSSRGSSKKSVPVVIGNPEEEPKPLPEIDPSTLPSKEDTPGILSDTNAPLHGRRSGDTFPVLASNRVLSILVEGNTEVVAEHILSVVTSKEGEQVNENQLARDTDAIFEQGFFSKVDYRLDDKPDGTNVVFVVTENPLVGEIVFHGNTVYSEETLRDLCLTKDGAIFNRIFFRNDLERIKEKYQQDGYVMARISDVRIDGTVVNVYISEPRIGEVVIQGNKRTKRHVIERQVKIKSGDLFNATRLRHTLGKLQGLGYFEDVSVGFEPSDDPEVVNLILTVSEMQTGKIGVSVGYGSQSGFSGGASYSDSNWLGRGQNFGVGFELGDREQYWITLAQPYMDQKVFGWRFGAYKRKWEDLSYYDEDTLQFNYDEDRKGAYVGLGRKFSERSKLSWYLTTEWQDIEISPHDGASPTPHQLEKMQSGKNMTLTGVLKRDNLDIYTPYPKGDVESLHVEKGMEVLGGDWSYWKYWFEAKYYRPVELFSDLLGRSFRRVGDTPPIFAARLTLGDADGTLPWASDYTIGGDSTLRGYKEKRFRGDQMFLANAELRFPVHKHASLVFFYDIGKAWDTSEGDGFDLGDLAKGYGIGVRLKTPIGNIRLDFADGDEESRVHFGFGEMF